mmetsp:Transcript_4812/g.12378  ORF Transcript_4812/g.12378 Transcript_4812/m.12378 type:complete len:381 (-) Transcript_4812:1111-2253(-)
MVAGEHDATNSTDAASTFLKGTLTLPPLLMAIGPCRPGSSPRPTRLQMYSPPSGCETVSVSVSLPSLLGSKRTSTVTSLPVLPSAGGTDTSLASSSKSAPPLIAHLYTAGAVPRRKLVNLNDCDCDAPSPALKWSVRVSTAGEALRSSRCAKPPSSGALRVSVALRSGWLPTTSGLHPSCSTAVVPAPTSMVGGTVTSVASHATVKVTEVSSGFSTSTACMTSCRTVAASGMVETTAAGVAFATTAYLMYSPVFSLVKVTSALVVPSLYAWNSSAYSRDWLGGTSTKSWPLRVTAPSSTPARSTATLKRCIVLSQLSTLRRIVFRVCAAHSTVTVPALAGGSEWPSRLCRTARPSGSGKKIEPTCGASAVVIVSGRYVIV